MKIGFVSVDDATDISSWSGTPYHILDALRRQDVSVEVYSPLSRDFRYALAPFKLAARLSNREVQLDRFPTALRSYARQLKRKMRSNPVDVLLATSSIPITMLDCAEPIVFFTDAIFHMMPGYYAGAFDRLGSRDLERGEKQEEAALQRCTIAVYSSNWAAEGARKLTQPGKVRVVQFGSSLPVDHNLETMRQWIRERLEGSRSECRLLFIGKDWERKGGAIAVESARLLNKMGLKTRLTLVGCQPQGEVPEFVEVLGYIDKRSTEGLDRLRELYRRAHFFILPSRAEASAIVYCEASSFGLPTIAFMTGGTEDYVRNGISGVCLPCDSKPEAFAESIMETIKDDERYSSLCIGAFNEYESRLNWDSAASALVQLCREALQSSRNGRG